MPPPAEGLASRLFMGPALRTQPDRRLVTLVREGYEAAFEEIVRRYGRPLGRYAASIVGGRSEDVLQDAFAKALPALQRDGAEVDLRPWLFRIVRNTALNDLRDSPPTPELLAEALAGGRNPADELEQREELADLIKRLQALPEPQRAAIVMRELEGLGHEEIAAALGLTDGGARQAIYRARRALRDGVGLLLPLPLMRLLADHGGEAAGMAAGGGASGALAAGASAGGAGAGGAALKLGVVAAVVAGSVGAGVAVQHHGDGSPAEAQAAAPHLERPAGDSPSTSAAANRASTALPADADRRRSAPSSSDDTGSPADAEAGVPGASRQVGLQGDGSGGGARLPARRRPPRGEHEGAREGGHRGDLSPHGGGPGPGPGEHSGGDDFGDGGDDGHSGDGSFPPPADSERHGDSGSGDGREEGSPPPEAEEGDSDGSGDGGGSGSSGEGSSFSGTDGAGQEYELP